MVRAADMLSEGPRFKSRLGHHFSMVLSSVRFPGISPCSVQNLQDMAAPNEMCSMRKKQSVVDLSFALMPDNLEVCWKN